MKKSFGNLPGNEKSPLCVGCPRVLEIHRNWFPTKSGIIMKNEVYKVEINLKIVDTVDSEKKHGTS